MFYLKTSASFDSAHFLYGYDGKCKNIHGHTWKVEVEIREKELIQEGEKRGMILDFSDLKREVKEMCDEMDHALIFEKGTLRSSTVSALEEEGFRLLEVPFRPTAENFAKFFFDKLKKSGLPVHRIGVYETPDNCAFYEE